MQADQGWCWEAACVGHRPGATRLPARYGAGGNPRGTKGRGRPRRRRARGGGTMRAQQRNGPIVSVGGGLRPGVFVLFERAETDSKLTASTCYRIGSRFRSALLRAITGTARLTTRRPRRGAQSAHYSPNDRAGRSAPTAQARGRVATCTRRHHTRPGAARLTSPFGQHRHRSHCSSPHQAMRAASAPISLVIPGLYSSWSSGRSATQTRASVVRSEPAIEAAF